MQTAELTNTSCYQPRRKETRNVGAHSSPLPPSPSPGQILPGGSSVPHTGIHKSGQQKAAQGCWNRPQASNNILSGTRMPWEISRDPWEHSSWYRKPILQVKVKKKKKKNLTANTSQERVCSKIFSGASCWNTWLWCFWLNMGCTSIVSFVFLSIKKDNALCHDKCVDA